MFKFSFNLILIQKNFSFFSYRNENVIMSSLQWTNTEKRLCAHEKELYILQMLLSRTDWRHPIKSKHSGNRCMSCRLVAKKILSLDDDSTKLHINKIVDWNCICSVKNIYDIIIKISHGGRLFEGYLMTSSPYTHTHTNSRDKIQILS